MVLGRAAALDVTGLTNLEGSASSLLDDLGERFLAGNTSKLMGRSRCEGGEDSGAWRSRISPDFGFLLVQVVRFHGLKNFAKLWKSTLQVFGVQLIFHELKLGVWKSVDEDHSKDVIKAHVAGGGRVKDGGEGAVMVEEDVSRRALGAPVVARARRGHVRARLPGSALDGEAADARRRGGRRATRRAPAPGR